MKKRIALILVLAVVFSLVACAGEGENKSKKVPDSYLKLEVEDYAYQEDIDESYTFSAEHSYDDESGLDNVTIEFRIPNVYADEVVVGTGAYKYNKSDETWSKARDIRWGEVSLKYKADKFLKTFQYKDDYVEYKVTVKKIDLDAGTITCEYDIVVQSLGSIWSKTLEAHGSGTFNMQKGHWYGFDIPTDEGKIHVRLSEQVGITVDNY